ncbi:MAG: ketoacyl-ACP synthase III [Hyphomonas sp.]|nr:ketoacyl-ACP synthase III [Hyphomonas sp.]
MIESSIAGTGSCAGGTLLASSEIDARLGRKSGWLESVSGVATRPVIAPGETQESLAVHAAREALRDAGITPEDVDLLLFASAVGRQPIPATAALLKRELGMTRAATPAFDINATCLGAVAAMEVASLYIGAGRAKTVLVVTSEIATRALPWDSDPSTAALFGDGAAAFVMTADGGGLKFVRSDLETWAEGYEYCTLAAGGTRFDFHTEREAFEQNSWFRMDGHALFKLTRGKLPRFIDRTLERAGWSKRDVSLVVPHQASPLALEHMIRKCGFARDRVVSTVKETGNLVSASIPMTLDKARRSGRVRPGDRILLVGTSAGVSFGAALLQA